MDTRPNSTIKARRWPRSCKKPNSNEVMGDNTNTCPAFPQLMWDLTEAIVRSFGGKCMKYEGDPYNALVISDLWDERKLKIRKVKKESFSFNHV